MILTGSCLTIERLRRERPENVVVYFYFDSQDTGTQSATSLISSLLRQLLERLEDIPPCAKARFDEFNRDSHLPKPTFKTLIQLFKDCSKCVPTIYMVLDAFDEVPETQRARALSIIETVCNGNVQVLVTTQPHLKNDIEKSVHLGITNVRITAHKSDIAQYVRSNLPQGLSQGLQIHITETIAEDASGMYNRAFEI
jgi:hypothetical protein